MTDKRELSIKVPVLARVEGEGALDIEVRDGNISHLHFKIFEPPRLFEKFLEGRSYTELPDIVARICGICPVAYQMSAVHAIEAIFGCEPGPAIRDLRRLMYCGEWIESHGLHIHLLALPDFFGYQSVAELAKRYPDQVKRGMHLQGLGNQIIRLLGKRSVHPVGVKVGGFYRLPSQSDAAALLDKLVAALPEAEAMIHWLDSINVVDDQQQFTSVSLVNAAEYPMNIGRLGSDQGLDISIDQFDSHFKEQQVPHSTALHSHLEGAPYLVGPLARLNLNHQRLPVEVQRLIADLGISFPSRNMFHSALARGIEIYYALLEAIRVLEAYQHSDSPSVEVTPRAGIGFGCTEAPRGTLWHRYEVDDKGDIVSARLVPPTSQNQARIEQDLYNSLQAFGLDRSDDELRLHAETVVRNYDPCISCSTHFIDLRIKRH